MARWLSDENFHGDIVRELMLRHPTLDLQRVQDRGLEEAEDPVILAWAATNNRLVLTYDRATMLDFGLCEGPRQCANAWRRGRAWIAWQSARRSRNCC